MLKEPEDRDRTDEELVARAQAGDGPEARAASAELLGRWRGRIYLWCRRFTRDHERALDLAQDVLIAVFRSLRQYEGRAPLGAWIFTITRRACIRAMRPTSLTRDDDADLELLADARPGPEDEVEDRMEEERVAKLIREHLDPQEQRAIWMRCVERLPVEEITEALGLESASGARGLLQTARRKLRAALERDERGVQGGAPQ